MKYNVITDKDEILQYDFFPAGVMKAIEKRKPTVIWAYDGDEPVAMALYSQNGTEHDKEVIFEYIFTLEDYRNMGVSALLVEYAEDMFSVQGIETVTAAFPDSIDDSMRRVVEDYVLAIGFEQKLTDCSLMEYSMDKVRTEKLKKYVGLLKGRGERVTPALVNRLFDMGLQMPDSVKGYLIQEKANQLSRLIRTKERLETAVLCEDKEEADIYISMLYLSKDKNAQKALVALLSDVIYSDEIKINNDKAKVYASEKMQMVYYYLFGEPDKRLRIKKYIKEL